jgi:hypothetical protein
MMVFLTILFFLVATTGIIGSYTKSPPLKLVMFFSYLCVKIFLESKQILVCETKLTSSSVCYGKKDVKTNHNKPNVKGQNSVASKIVSRRGAKK